MLVEEINNTTFPLGCKLYMCSIGSFIYMYFNISYVKVKTKIELNCSDLIGVVHLDFMRKLVQSNLL